MTKFDADQIKYIEALAADLKRAEAIDIRLPYSARTNFAICGKDPQGEARNPFSWS